MIMHETNKFTCESCSTKLPEVHPFSIILLTTYYPKVESETPTFGISQRTCKHGSLSLEVLHTCRS